MRTPPWSALVPTALAATLVVACSSTTALPAVQYDNKVDTTTLAALTGTAIGVASAFDGVQGIPARTDLNAAFDFAVDIDATGTLQLLPAGALGFSADPGLLISNRSFDGVTSAPSSGYVMDSVLTADVGTVFVLRSRLTTQQCAVTSALPRYAKFHVLAIDQQTRVITLEYLANLNCGYRGLEPGTPSN